MTELSQELRAHVDISFISNTEDENPRYLLTIKASAEYNVTTVQCLLFGDGFYDQSDIVSLIIQGKDNFSTRAF